MSLLFNFRLLALRSTLRRGLFHWALLSLCLHFALSCFFGGLGLADAAAFARPFAHGLGFGRALRTALDSQSTVTNNVTFMTSRCIMSPIQPMPMTVKRQRVDQLAPGHTERTNWQRTPFSNLESMI